MEAAAIFRGFSALGALIRLGMAAWLDRRDYRILPAGAAAAPFAVEASAPSDEGSQTA